MTLSAKDIPSADSTGAPYVTGNFAPLMNEVTAFDLEVIGRIPETLNGRFLRIGPNPVDEPNSDLAQRPSLVRGRAAWRTACGCATARRNGFAAASSSTSIPPRSGAASPSLGRAKASATPASTRTSPSSAASSAPSSRPAIFLSNSTMSSRASAARISAARSRPASAATPNTIRSRASSTCWPTNRSSRCATSRSAATDAQRPRHASTCRTSR